MTGALHNPKGMTLNSYKTCGAISAVFSQSARSFWIWLYAWSQSIDAIVLLVVGQARHLSVAADSYLFSSQNSAILLSTQNLRFPSLFFTKTTSEDQAEFECSLKSFFSISLTCFRISKDFQRKLGQIKNYVFRKPVE